MGLSSWDEGTATPPSHGILGISTFILSTLLPVGSDVDGEIPWFWNFYFLKIIATYSPHPFSFSIPALMVEKRIIILLGSFPFYPPTQQIAGPCLGSLVTVNFHLFFPSTSKFKLHSEKVGAGERRKSRNSNPLGARLERDGPKKPM